MAGKGVAATLVAARTLPKHESDARNDALVTSEFDSSWEFFRKLKRF